MEPTAAAIHRLRRPVRLWVIGGMMAVAPAVAAIELSRNGNPYAAWAWAAAATIVAAMVPATIFHLRRRAERALIVGPDALTWEDGDVRHILAWEQIATVRMTGRGLVLLDRGERSIQIPLMLEGYGAAVQQVMAALDRVAKQREPRRSVEPVPPATIRLAMRDAIQGGVFTAILVLALAWGNLLTLAAGLLLIVFMWFGLGRRPYAITIGRSVRLHALLGDHAAPMGAIEDS